MKSFSLPLFIAIACSGTLASADCFDADFIKTTLIKVAEWQLQHLPPRCGPPEPFCSPAVK
ncbi:MAG: hypothetical protein ACKVY0_15675 [Prosthecobacter sp.]|uniref:hypothetical protein n=1 Tax=Prosthecobacter sp. TaxID=1965333 RepID=UPI0039008168